MKKNLHVFAVVFGLSALAGTGRLHAQDRMEIATIPFDFQVGTTKLAAGTWAASVNNTPGTVHLTNRETRESIMFSAAVPKSTHTSRSELVFHKYGTRYFLAEVWFPGEPGRCTVKSKTEKEFAAATRATPEVKFVAAR